MGTRYLGFPLWGWLTLVAATLVAAVGLGMAIWPRSAAGPEQAVARRAASPPGFEEPDVLAQGGPDADRELPPAGSSGGQTTPGSGPPTSSPRGSSSPTGRRAGPQFEMEFGPPKVAESLEEIKDAIVKLIVPLPDGEETGTGFLIDGRGWVATNYHVIEHANVATKAVLANGMECRLAGVLAKSPEYDLAILQLAERPYQLTILDISYDGKPKLGAEVFAYGHPYGVDFSLSKGIVSRIVTTGELEDSEPDHLVREINSPAATEWIQHTAKISPGNSGGPLLDARAEVLGVNTFVHTAAEYGFASHVRYLRELAAKAENASPEPLPEVLIAALPEDPHPGTRPGPTVITAEGMKELFELAESFKFRPRIGLQYEVLAGLAKMLAFSKRAQVRHIDDSRISEKTVEQLAELADELFSKLSTVTFTKEEMLSNNRFALPYMEPGAGTLFFGKVLAVVPPQDSQAGEPEPSDSPLPANVGQIQLGEIVTQPPAGPAKNKTDEKQPAEAQSNEGRSPAGDSPAPRTEDRQRESPEVKHQQSAGQGAEQDQQSPGNPLAETQRSVEEHGVEEGQPPDSAAEKSPEQHAEDVSNPDQQPPQSAGPDQEPSILGMFMQLEGTPLVVFVPVEAKAELKPKGTKWMVVGIVSFHALVIRGNDSERHLVPLVLAPYLSPR